MPLIRTITALTVGVLAAATLGLPAAAAISDLPAPPSGTPAARQDSSLSDPSRGFSIPAVAAAPLDMVVRIDDSRWRAIPGKGSEFYDDVVWALNHLNASVPGLRWVLGPPASPTLATAAGTAIVRYHPRSGWAPCGDPTAPPCSDWITRLDVRGRSYQAGSTLVLSSEEALLPAPRDYRRSYSAYLLAQAMGLGFYPDRYEGAAQLMGGDFSVIAAPGYQAGDLNGLRTLAANPAVTTFNPVSVVGGIDAVRTGPGGLIVTGWAVDRNNPMALVNLIAATDQNTSSGYVRPSIARPDIAARFPGGDGTAGFSIPLSLTRFGDVRTCVYATSSAAPPGTPVQLLGCASATVRSGNPFGNFEAARQVGPRTLRLAGWALDPDTVDPTRVHVYVDGRYAGELTTDTRRPDVGRAFPGYGDSRGFSADLAISPGRRTVCAYAINAGPGTTNPLLGCRAVDVRGGDPVGSVDVMRQEGPRTLRLAGWTLDPDTVDPTKVHVYVDGRYAGELTADRVRGDVGRAFPGYGSARGFDVSLSVPSGRRTVCVFAINAGPGTTNPLLGCRAVDVRGGDPVGNFEVLRSTSAGTRVSGWALDFDTTGPVSLHVYVNGRYVTAATADARRPDVARAFRGYGPDHGFSFDIPASPGRAEVCVFAINAGPGSVNTLLGCRVVSVPMR